MNRQSGSLASLKEAYGEINGCLVIYDVLCYSRKIWLLVVSTSIAFLGERSIEAIEREGEECAATRMAQPLEAGLLKR